MSRERDLWEWSIPGRLVERLIRFNLSFRIFSCWEVSLNKLHCITFKAEIAINERNTRAKAICPSPQMALHEGLPGARGLRSLSRAFLHTYCGAVFADGRWRPVEEVVTASCEG
jgi:hypothetical protein